MVFNGTGLNNITSLQGMAYYTNVHTDGLLFTGGIIVLYFVMIMVLLKNDEPFINVLATSSWSMFILSMFFWLAQLIPTLLVLGFLMLGAFSVLFMYANRSQY